MPTSPCQPAFPGHLELSLRRRLHFSMRDGWVLFLHGAITVLHPGGWELLKRVGSPNPVHIHRVLYWIAAWTGPDWQSHCSQWRCALLWAELSRIQPIVISHLLWSAKICGFGCEWVVLMHFMHDRCPGRDSSGVGGCDVGLGGTEAPGAGVWMTGLRPAPVRLPTPSLVTLILTASPRRLNLGLTAEACLMMALSPLFSGRMPFPLWLLMPLERLSLDTVRSQARCAQYGLCKRGKCTVYGCMKTL